MGHQVSDCAASMVAMRTDARNNLYHNPMAVSQILPALHHKSYLALKNMQCLGEDGRALFLSLQPLAFSGFILKCKSESLKKGPSLSLVTTFKLDLNRF